MTSRITITYTKNLHVTLSLQFQLLAGIGNDTSLIILEAYSYDAHICTVRIDFCTVGSHFNNGSLVCGLDNLLHNRLSKLISYSLNLAWFIYTFPLKMTILRHIFLLKFLAIHNQLNLLTI